MQLGGLGKPWSLRMPHKDIKMSIPQETRSTLFARNGHSEGWGATYYHAQPPWTSDHPPDLTGLQLQRVWGTQIHTFKHLNPQPDWAWIML